MRIASLIHCLFLYLGVSTLQANTEYIYQSTTTGRTPYLIVRPDETGGSQRDPGIYYGDSDGNWLPALKGKVLAGETSQGILAEFSLTKLTDRYEALAVVDGAIVIFTLSSRLDRPGSVIEIGSDKVQPVDIASARPYRLPKIQSLRDIRITLMDTEPTEGQGFLISIRNPSPLGTGITFAAMLRKGGPSRNAELTGSPKILDYEFRDFASLQALVHPEYQKIGVIPDDSLRALTRENSDDHPTLKLWRRALLQKLDGLKPVGSRGVGNDSSMDVPRLDLVSGTIKLGFYPQKSLQVGGIQLYQIYDPRDGNHKVFSTEKVNNISRGYVYSGAIDFDESTRSYIAFHAPRAPHIAAFVSRGELVACMGFPPVAGSGFPLGISTLVLERSVGAFLAADLAISAEIVKGDGEEELIYLFVSSKTPQPKTVVYILSRQGQSLTLKRSYPISSIFFPPEQLLARIHIDVPGKILFDTVTPAVETIADYKAQHRNTVPFLNIGASSAGYRRQVYKRALEEIKFNNLVVYKQFDTVGAEANQSGLYVYRGSEKAGLEIDPRRDEMVEFLEGQILRRTDTAQPTPTLANAILTAPPPSKANPLPDASVTLVAIDSNQRQGDSGFQYVFSISPLGAGSSYFQPFVFSREEAGFSFKQIRSIQVLQGRGKFKDRLTLLIAVEGDPGMRASDFARQGGLVISSYRLGGHRGSEGVRLNFSEVLTRKIMGQDSVKDLSKRVAMDPDGRFYLLAQRDIAVDDPRFKLFDLFSDNFKEIYPNRGTSKGLKLSVGEEMRHSGVSLEEEFDTHRVENPWQIFSRPDLKRLSSAVLDDKKDSDKPTDKIDKAKKTDPKDSKGDEQILYPKLDIIMDRLSDPDKPNQHLVMLVSTEQKEVVRKLLLGLFTKRARGDFRFENHRLRFAVLDADKASQEDALQNLLDLQENRPGEKSLLFADASDLVAIERPTAREDSENTKYVVASHEADPVMDLPHILDLISREGRVGKPESYREPPVEKKMSVLILATLDEWDQLRDADNNRGWNKPCGTRFELSNEFLHSNWRVWPTAAKKNGSDIQGYMNQPATILDRDVFPGLVANLESLADPTVPPRHLIQLVPAEIMPILHQIIFRLYGAKDGKSGNHWSALNQHLKVFTLDRSDSKQSTVFGNFQAMRRDNGEDRSVLIGSLDTVKQIGRPVPDSSDTNPFMIQDPASAALAVDPLSQAEDRRRSRQVPPHLLWLIETDGHRISTSDFPKYGPSDYRVATMLLGTEDEWNLLQAELTLEQKAGLVERFEVETIRPPTEAVKKRLVNQILNRPEIDAIGYTFVVEGNKGGNPREQLVGFLVNKTELLASQFGIESTAAFMRVLVKLLDALVEDVQARKTKTLDKHFVERLLTRVFNIPMNLAALPADDIDVRLSNKRKVAFALQSAGHLGPIGKKFQLVESLQAHLRGGDLGRNLPSSVIVFGDSSTGKTMLFEKFIEVMGLKVYDFNVPDDPAANAFFVRVAEIENAKVDGGHAGSGRTIDDIIEHFENFLTLPEGFRGFVFIDDLDKAKSPDILNGLIGMMNRLFEARGGIIEVSSLGTDSPEAVSVRNIRLLMSLNPPTTPEKMKRFAASKSDVDMIVAALSRDGVEVHPAFVMRWGELLKLPHFEAKGPALSGALRKAAMHEFNNDGRFTLVDPSAVTQVSAAFPTSNAREFLSPASNLLLDTARRALSRDTKVGIVLPSDRLSTDADNSVDIGLKPPFFANSANEATGIASGRIAEFIRINMTALAAGRADLDGRLVFVSMMLDSVRAFLYEKFTEAVMQDIHYAEEPLQREYVLAPLLGALVGHLTEKPAIPLKAVNLDAYDFGVTQSRRQAFLEAVKRADIRAVDPFFPYRFADEFSGGHDLRVITEGKRPRNPEKSRAHLLLEVSLRATTIEKRLAALLMRVASIESFPHPEQWIAQLTDDDFRVELQRVGGDILALFQNYWDRFYSDEFVETRRPEDFEAVSSYDAIRLFLYALDKGLTRLPWAQSTAFLLSALERAAGDLELSQNPGLQRLLFSSPTSIFRPASMDYVFQQADSSEVFRRWDLEEMRARSKRFSTYCSQFLIQVGHGQK